MSKFASGRHARGICDRCGHAYPLLELREEIINDHPSNMFVCPECFEYDHPQLQLGKRPVDDPQALRNARPDQPDRKTAWGWAPVGGGVGSLTPNPLVASGAVGDVTVTVV